MEVKQQIETPVNKSELAKVLNVDRKIICNLTKEFKIPFIPIGKRIFYQPSKVLAALEINPKETLHQ